MVGTESVAMNSFVIWGYLETMPWVIGDFIWTAIDYYGDMYFPSTSGDVDYLSGRIPFPWHISNSGDLDVIGHPKPQSLYRTVLWGVRNMSMLVHRPSLNGTDMVPGLPEHLSLWGWPDEEESWSWPGNENRPVQIRVFSRGCQESRLLLNGSIVSESKFQTNLTALHTILYKPGTLTAMCINGTEPVQGITASLRTEGVPAKIILTTDRQEIIQSPTQDLVYLTATIVDTYGTIVHRLRPQVTFKVTGDGKLFAVGSADPMDIHSLRTNIRTVWRGRALAIVGPHTNVNHGEITVVATAAGLPPATVTISVHGIVHTAAGMEP